MSEHLSITIPRGYGSVQSLADGSLQVTLPMGNDIDGYCDLSRSFIALGVGLMSRGRELHGDLRPEHNTTSNPGKGNRIYDNRIVSESEGRGIAGSEGTAASQRPSDRTRTGGSEVKDGALAAPPVSSPHSDLIEQVRIYLTWVPPDHAAAATRAIDRLEEQLETLRQAVTGWESRVDDEQEVFSVERGDTKRGDHALLLDGLTSDQADVLEDWIDHLLALVSNPATQRRIEVGIAGDGSGVALPPLEDSVGVEPIPRIAGPELPGASPQVAMRTSAHEREFMLREENRRLREQLEAHQRLYAAWKAVIHAVDGIAAVSSPTKEPS